MHDLEKVRSKFSKTALAYNVKWALNRLGGLKDSLRRNFEPELKELFQWGFGGGRSPGQLKVTSPGEF